jgi:hypothetical protein
MALAGPRSSPLCPTCATTAPAGARFCPQCGAALSGSTLRFPAPPPPPATAAGSGTPAANSGRPAPTARTGPALPVAVLSVALALIVVFGVLGLWWTEVILVPVALVMAFMCLESVWERWSGILEQRGRRTAERLWAFGRVARVAVVSRWRAAATHLSVWARRVPVQRRHERALHLFGKAVYHGDDYLAQVYRSMASSTEDRLAELRRQLHKAQREAEKEIVRERAATDATELIAADPDG